MEHIRDRMESLLSLAAVILTDGHWHSPFALLVLCPLFSSPSDVPFIVAAGARMTIRPQRPRAAPRVL